ncbi:NAD(P)H-dependent glycerol-3-phosphate dehydrogenase [Clostridium sediminicola]|uniref:NAD(P)H-dependent glycerol-3-phosphate dehydrogenase n=1 Tax=Clostridium sediminicola TaxID=3114879 RepID=UPI0031F1E598
MEKITFIGAGSFGTALAVTLSKKGYDIKMWDRSPHTIDDINIKKENIKYLPNVILPSNIYATCDIHEAIEDSKIIVLAIPSHAIREVCCKLKPFTHDYQIIVNIAKGIEEGTHKRLSEIVEDELPANPVVVLSGPSHAEEVAQDLPTTLVAASKNNAYAMYIQEIFTTSKLRVYTNDDIIGVEIGAAVKNIIALAAGVSDGIGFGDNTKAALMTRGISEIKRIGEKLGGKKETFSGLTGIGDLIVTCTSMHSRNRRAGILIGKGASYEKAIEEVGMVVEGIKACRAFYKLKEELEVSMPITDALYNVLFNEKEPKYAVYELMTREKKHEINE